MGCPQYRSLSNGGARYGNASSGVWVEGCAQYRDESSPVGVGAQRPKRCFPHCAGAMLILSVVFQFYRMIPVGNPISDRVMLGCAKLLLRFG